MTRKQAPTAALQLILLLALLYWLKISELTVFEFFGLAPIYPNSHLAPMLVVFAATCVGTWFVDEPLRQRITLAGGLLVGTMAYPLMILPMLALTLLIHTVIHRVGKSIYIKLPMLVLLHVLLALAAWQDEAIRSFAIIFSTLTFFRTLRYLHEVARKKYALVPLQDYLNYMLPAASFIIHPYLVVIPPFTKPRRPASRIKLHRSGFESIVFGLVYLIAAYLVVAGLREVFPEPPTTPLLWHWWTMGDLLYILLHCAAHAGFLVGLMNLQGLETRPAMAHPWFAKNLFEYWNRFIIHYKDLQVSIFYFPTMLSMKKRKREVGILAAVAVTFILGNDLLHVLGRYMYTEGLFTVMPRGLVQNSVVAAVMAVAFLWEEYKAKRKARGAPLPIGDGLLSRLLRIYLTLAIMGAVWHLRI